MLQVKDLMSNALEAVSPEAHLHDVLIKMNRAGYRHLPVVADDKLVGIITDRDLRLAVTHRLSRGELNVRRRTFGTSQTSHIQASGYVLTGVPSRSCRGKYQETPK